MARQNILIRSKKKKARALLEAGRLDEAASLYAKLSRIAPKDIDIWLGLGVVEGKKGNHGVAAGYFQKAASIEPSHAQIQYNLGVALRDSGKFEAAIPAFENATQLNPKYGEAFDCLAHAYISVRNFDRAIDAFQRALAVEPGKAETYSNLGSVLQAKGLLSEAEACYRKAVLLKPGITIAENLGSVLCSQGRFEEAIAVYREGLKRQPKNARLMSNLLLTLNYLPGADRQTVFEEHVAYGKMLERGGPSPTFSNVPEPDRRLRIGYVSPDFREHSVTYFIEPVLEQHDRQWFELYGYSTLPQPDAVTRRLQGYCDEWRNVAGLSPGLLAEKIREDRIDILVDLAGHTAGTSLPVFALHPAPVQATWLGYPNTTGLTAIRYRITDGTADPDGQELYYTEDLVRLPGCFLCYKPPADAPEVSILPALSGNGITFGSFNNLSKINEDVIRLWCEVLSSVPNSRLLVKNSSLTDETTRERYRSLFEARGFGGDRVSLIGHTPTRQEHLALYGRVDIGLDTFPYNGTTTTCEALWMGVPVMTLTGTAHAGKVGKSLLTCVGLDEWVADSPEQLVTTISGLAAEQDKLAQLRETLRNRLAASPLCNSVTFTQNIEYAYRAMWSRWCESSG